MVQQNSREICCHFSLANYQSHMTEVIDQDLEYQGYIQKQDIKTWREVKSKKVIVPYSPPAKCTSTEMKPEKWNPDLIKQTKLTQNWRKKNRAGEQALMYGFNRGAFGRIRDQGPPKVTNGPKAASGGGESPWASEDQKYKCR